MLKRSLAVFLGILVLNVSLGTSAFAQTKAEKKTAKMKAEIQQLGTGKAARVKLKLGDGSIVRGYVTEIKENTFVVMKDGTNSTVEIEYADASKAPAHIPKGLKIVGYVALGFLAFVLIAVAACKTSGCD
jgi:ribosomal protein S1